MDKSCTTAVVEVIERVPTVQRTITKEQPTLQTQSGKPAGFFSESLRAIIIVSCLPDLRSALIARHCLSG